MITDKLNIKKRKMRSVYLSLNNIQTICQQLVFKQYFILQKTYCIVTWPIWLPEQLMLTQHSYNKVIQSDIT